jgi:hypothetical protein
LVARGAKKKVSVKLSPETAYLLKALKIAWRLRSLDEVVSRLIERAGVRVEVRVEEGEKV